MKGYSAFPKAPPSDCLVSSTAPADWRIMSGGFSFFFSARVVVKSKQVKLWWKKYESKTNNVWYSNCYTSHNNLSDHLLDITQLLFWQTEEVPQGIVIDYCLHFILPMGNYSPPSAIGKIIRQTRFCKVRKATDLGEGKLYFA